MKDLIYRETARRIINSPRTQKQMLDVLASVNAVEVIPTSKVEDAIAEIERIEINGQIDANTMFARSAGQVKTMVLDIIRKHTGVSE